MTKNRNLAGMLPDGNAMMVPSGNTAQRPANTAGMIRFNTDLNTLEAANGTYWANVGSGSSSATSVEFLLLVTMQIQLYLLTQPVIFLIHQTFYFLLPIIL